MRLAATWKELTVRQQRRIAIRYQNKSAIKVKMAEALRLAQKEYDSDDNK